MRNGPGMMGMMDRPPMTREEFMEVQERQRQERHRQHRMMDHSERFIVLIIPILSEVGSVLLCRFGCGSYMKMYISSLFILEGSYQ